MITREMQNLKSEIYSEQNGLSAQLQSIAQRAEELDGGRGSSCGGSDQRGGGPASAAGGGLRERPASRCPSGAGKERRTSGTAPSGVEAPPRRAEAAPRRRVEFTPDTHDPVPMRQRRGLTRSQPVPQPSWTPYVVGFTLLCLGPLRPLLYDLFTTVPKLLAEGGVPAAGGGGVVRPVSARTAKSRSSSPLSSSGMHTRCPARACDIILRRGSMTFRSVWLTVRGAHLLHSL